MPLFRLTIYMSSSNESLPLASRAAGIFTKKLCHMKEASELCVMEQSTYQLTTSCLYCRNLFKLISYEIETMRPNLNVSAWSVLNLITGIIQYMC